MSSSTENIRPASVQAVIRRHPIPNAAITLGVMFAAFLAVESWVLSVGIITLVALPVLLWRVGEPPTLAFCFVYQWLFCNIGFWVWHFSGFYPDSSVVGEIDRAVLLSNLGLLCMAGAVRLSATLFGSKVAVDETLLNRLNLPALFRLTIVAYCISWMVFVTPSGIWFGGAQIINNLLLYRDVPLVLLLWGSLRQRRHTRLAIGALMFAAIPTLTSPQAKLSHYLFLSIVVLLAEWQPKSLSHLRPTANPKVLRYLYASVAATMVFSAIWLGGVKPVWRQMSQTGDLVDSTAGRLGQLASVVNKVSRDFNFSSAFESIANRTSSDLLYFSFVLERVPRKIPHEEGKLTEAALLHVIMPRFLFPEKAITRSPSWMVRKYAGVNCADERSGTSISFGYVSEWYIDWGIFGLFASLAVWGSVLHLGCLLLEKSSRSRLIGQVMFVPCGLQHCAGYGADVTRMLGGFIQAVLIAAVVLFVWNRMMGRRKDHA